MAYRDRPPICPTCEVALEPGEIQRAVDITNRPQSPRARPLLQPRILALPPWPTWTCSACGGQLLTDDHLASLVDAASGDVRALDARVAPAAALGVTCPRCAATLAGVALLGDVVGRCPAHGVWVPPGALAAIVRAPRRG